MRSEIIHQLHQLNQEFYQSFADSFSATRQRIQPGVRKVLDTIPLQGNLLDIGCGNGNLGMEWAAEKRQGVYCGVDFSEKLLNEARKIASLLDRVDGLTFCFYQADLLDPSWLNCLPDLAWDGAVMFAVLHHIPDDGIRRELLKSLRRLIRPGCPLFLSVWQIRNSQRLLRRIQPWSLINLEKEDVDAGDVLMDWRAEENERDKEKALRYVHLFTEEELGNLAFQSGFEVNSSFYSDGREGNLALYQKWV